MGKRGKIFWRYGRSTDFVTWLITVLVDLDWGLAIGLLMMVNSIFQMLARAKVTDLGQSPNGDNKNYIDQEKGGVEYPGVKVIKMDTALFFGSKDRFFDKIASYFKVKKPNLA